MVIAVRYKFDIRNMSKVAVKYAADYRSDESIGKISSRFHLIGLRPLKVRVSYNVRCNRLGERNAEAVYFFDEGSTIIIPTSASELEKLLSEEDGIETKIKVENRK